MKVLRIVFCILACLAVAACVPVGIYFQWWCLVCVLAAGVFGLLMLGAKNNFRRPVTPPKPDFMNTDEENQKIADEANKHDDENA